MTPDRRQGLFSTLALAAALAAPACADPASNGWQTLERPQRLPDLYEDALLDGVVLDAGRQGAVLERWVVIEDDSAGAGIGQEPDGSPRENYDRIAGPRQAKKLLVLPAVAARGAVLSFYGSEPVGEGLTGTVPLFVRVNGTVLRKESDAMNLPPAYRRSRDQWIYLTIPPDAVRAGTNEFVFYTESEAAPWTLRISETRYFEAGGWPSNAPFPRRSARSKDGGASWVSDGLGPGGSMQGEYMVRLMLDQHRAEGRLISPVFDLGEATADQHAITRCAMIRDMTLRLDADCPAGTAVALEYRAGNTWSVLPNHWSHWVPAAKVKQFPRGRYGQWRAVLTTDDPSVSPIVKAVAPRVTLRALPAPDAGRVYVTESRNARIVRPSFDYAYEVFDHPSLVELRRNYQLDLVLEGADTNFEKILRLKRWTARQYAREALQAWFLRNEGHRRYPPWDAHRILNQNGYSCVSFAVLFMQVCQAFGIPCRHVQVNAWCIGGHEVNEVWSDDFGKWFFVDAGYNYYVCDPATGVPLSIAELAAALARCQATNELVEVGAGLRVPAKVVTEGALPLRYVVEPSPMNEIYRSGAEPADRAGFMHKHAAWMFFQAMIPRNDFYSNPTPMPLNQGTSHWPWNGYVVWADGPVPRRPQYSRYALKPGDFYWTLNQAAFRLEYGETPGYLTVQLDTETPDFRSFQARQDGGEWRDVQSVFAWPLHPGFNALELCAQNRAGTRGRASRVVVLYQDERPSAFPDDP